MKIKLLIAGLLAWVSVGAQAQVYAPQSTIILPVTIPANTSTNISDVTLDVRKQKKVGIYVAIQGDDTGTNGVCTFTFARSVDGVNYQSLAAARPTITLAADGVSLTSKIVELDTFGTGYFKLVSINNGDEVGLTNVVLKYGLKLQSP